MCQFFKRLQIGFFLEGGWKVLSKPALVVDCHIQLKKWTEGHNFWMFIGLCIIVIVEE